MKLRLVQLHTRLLIAQEKFRSIAIFDALLTPAILCLRNYNDYVKYADLRI